MTQLPNSKLIFHCQLKFEFVPWCAQVFEGKAQVESKAERTSPYVSILIRLATRPSDI